MKIPALRDSYPVTSNKEVQAELILALFAKCRKSEYKSQTDSVTTIFFNEDNVSGDQSALDRSINSIPNSAF